MLKIKQKAIQPVDGLAILFYLEEWETCQILGEEMVPYLQKGKKKNSANYGPACLTGIYEKIQVQIIRLLIWKHLENKIVIAVSQHGFVKNKTCQTNCISVFDWVNSLIDCGNAVDIRYTLILVNHLTKYPSIF